MVTLGARLLLSCHQVPLFCVTTRLGSLGERIRSRLKRSARVALAHSPPQPRWVGANEEGAPRPNCPRGSPAANLERCGRSRPSLQGPPPGARRLGQQWGPGGGYPAGGAGGQTRLTTGGIIVWVRVHGTLRDRQGRPAGRDSPWRDEWGRGAGVCLSEQRWHTGAPDRAGYLGKQ